MSLLDYSNVVKLKHFGDEDYLLLVKVILVAEVLELDNVRMVQQRHRLYLVLDTIDDCLWQVILDNLDGHLLFLDSVKSEFDFAGEAVSDGLDDLVASDLFWHFYFFFIDTQFNSIIILYFKYQI